MRGSAAQRILEAAHLAAITHRRHRRLKGARERRPRPYIEHPIEVALMTAGAGAPVSEDALRAALLHDTVEDGDLTFEAIEARFGERTAAMVRTLTDPAQISAADKHVRSLHEIARMEPETRWVKVADKIANARDIAETQPKGWAPEKIEDYVERACAVIARAGPLPEGLERQARMVLGEKLDRARKARPVTVGEHLERQIAFSARTFGPGSRDAQVTAHIERERAEARRERCPERKRTEYMDVAMLAIDGLWRRGWERHGGNAREAALECAQALGAAPETALDVWIGHTARGGTPGQTASGGLGQTRERYRATAYGAIAAALETEGANARNVARALREKLALNERRTWPDWRTRSREEPLEHMRGGER